MTIKNFTKNCMGTVSFDGIFPGMRKEQDFIVYPLPEAVGFIKVQSDTRIGTINLATGEVSMSPPRAGGAFFKHMCLAKSAGTLTADELLMLKANVMATASGKAGINGVIYTDNSGALDVFCALDVFSECGSNTP